VTADATLDAVDSDSDTPPCDTDDATLSNTPDDCTNDPRAMPVQHNNYIP
jgi:hypothetical protein